MNIALWFFNGVLACVIFNTCLKYQDFTTKIIFNCLALCAGPLSFMVAIITISTKKN